MSRTLSIPLQIQTTVAGTHHGDPVVIPAELIQAIDAWMCIKDEQEADRVALVLQERINELWLQTPY